MKAHCLYYFKQQPMYFPLKNVAFFFSLEFIIPRCHYSVSVHYIIQVRAFHFSVLLAVRLSVVMEINGKGHYRISLLNWPPDLAFFFFFFFFHKTKICPLQRFIIELFGNKFF